MADRRYTQQWSEAEQLHLWEFDESETIQMKEQGLQISGDTDISPEWVGDLLQARSPQQGNRSS